MTRTDYMIGIAAGAFVGLVIGYFGGAFLGCKVLWPESNLCGFLGVFVGAPLGAVAGGVALAFVGRGRVSD